VTGEQRSMVAALFETLGEYVVLSEIDQCCHCAQQSGPVYLFFQALKMQAIGAALIARLRSNSLSNFAGSMEVWKTSQRVNPRNYWRCQHARRLVGRCLLI
jgi:pyrroline-5-carboxylate reductase